MTGEKTAKRLVRLRAVLNKTLESSKKEIDYDEIVRECYEPEELKQMMGNEDGGDGSPTMITNLLKDMLDSVNDKILSDFDDVVKAYDLNKSLLEVERNLEELKREKRNNQENEKRKRKATQDAVELASSFPEGKTPVDLAVCHTYLAKLKMKDQLKQEIKKLRSEIVAIRGEIDHGVEKIDESIADMKSIESRMAKTANICAFGSS